MPKPGHPPTQDAHPSVRNRHRHDVSNITWETIAPHLSGGPGKVGHPAEDNRNGVFRILRTGAPWRDLPPDYGQWNTTAHRFGRWQKKRPVGRASGCRARCSDLAWLMIDASYVKVYQPGMGAPVCNQAIGRNTGKGV